MASHNIGSGGSGGFGRGLGRVRCRLGRGVLTNQISTAPTASRSADSFDVVTGAFSYSGAAIARKLQAVGRRVRTLTGHPERGWVDPAIELRPLDFADPVGLVQALRGATTLYNTYWIRFADGKVDHRTAVANSRVL